MSILVQLRDSVNVIREFVAPSYRPERHYMRGPGRLAPRVPIIDMSA